MPIFIAHRGNFNGVDMDNENRVDYLKNALSLGYGVECDVCYWNGEFYFGHDEPQEKVSHEILLSSKSFCHAKDLESLAFLNIIGANCFWHDSDKVTYTSKGNMWCYPGVFVNTSNAIWLDLLGIPLPKTVSPCIYGICGDVLRS